MEKFKIVDLKVGETQKEHKNYYYAVLYSSLEYLVHAFLSEEDFNFLKTVDYFDYNVEMILTKRYNRKTNDFSYYININ